MLFIICRIYLKSWLFKTTLQEYHLTVSNSLNPDQVRHFVGPDLDSNCLQRLSAGEKSSHKSGKFVCLI